MIMLLTTSTGTTSRGKSGSDGMRGTVPVPNWKDAVFESCTYFDFNWLSSWRKKSFYAGKSPQETHSKCASCGSLEGVSPSGNAVFPDSSNDWGSEDERWQIATFKFNELLKYLVIKLNSCRLNISICNLIPRSSVGKWMLFFFSGTCLFLGTSRSNRFEESFNPSLIFVTRLRW